METGDPLLDRAQQYALAVLGADFTGETHVAATGYYVNAWVRDSFAWGMIPSERDSSVGSYATTEIAYWLRHPQPFGGWLTAPKSGYFDETPILISAVLDAYRVTGDLQMVRTALPHLERGWHWLAKGYIRPTKGSTVLIYATVPPHVAADWVDQVGRRGYATQLEALWYWATRSLGIMESLSHHAERAHYYGSFASRIRADINRLLWTDQAPYVHNASRVAPFGHYRSWLGSRGYFELDSNYLCILYGIASRQQAASINRFVVAHDRYLLGLNGEGVPARVLYGDYARSDYAAKHERLGADRYQSASWPSVGALVALGMAHSGELAEARAVLLRLGAAFVSGDDVREWYTAAGTGEGAPRFGWAARMFIIALYTAYLGINAYDSHTAAPLPAGLRLQVPVGQGQADLTYGGRSLSIDVFGAGSHISVTAASQNRYSPILPVSLLCASCTVRAIWSG